MPAKGESQSRDEIETAILRALVDRSDDGMTIFELRSHVEADIDEIEAALTRLKDDGSIVVESRSGSTDQTVIKPTDAVLPDDSTVEHTSLLDRVREWLPF